MSKKDVAILVSLEDESDMAYLRLTRENVRSVRQAALVTHKAGGSVVLGVDADGRRLASSRSTWGADCPIRSYTQSD